MQNHGIGFSGIGQSRSPSRTAIMSPSQNAIAFHPRDSIFADNMALENQSLLSGNDNSENRQRYWEIGTGQSRFEDFTLRIPAEARDRQNDLASTDRYDLMMGLSGLPRPEGTLALIVNPAAGEGGDYTTITMANLPAELRNQVLAPVPPEDVGHHRRLCIGIGTSIIGLAGFATSIYGIVHSFTSKEESHLNLYLTTAFAAIDIVWAGCGLCILPAVAERHDRV